MMSKCGRVNERREVNLLEDLVEVTFTPRSIWTRQMPQRVAAGSDEQHVDQPTYSSGDEKQSGNSNALRNGASD
jgi:hypothetical protein